MVTSVGRYFGLVFKGYRGVTQGDPLYPILFDIVVDAVIRHWVTAVASNEDGMEGIYLLIRDLADYFYSNNGIVALLICDD